MADRTPPAGDGVPREHRDADPSGPAPGPDVARGPAPAGDPPRRSRRDGRRSARRGGEKQAGGEGSDTLWGSVREILLVLVWAVLIAFVVKTLLVRGFYIPSGSMENTLQLNDRIFVNVVEPTFGPLERGDIVVFEDTKGWLPERPDTPAGPGDAVYNALAFVGVLPDRTDQHLIKRVVGVGGDRVVCCDDSGRITVNGESLEERDAYLFPGSAPSEISFDVVVPEDHYFVMGDHRDASADSRVHFQELVENGAFINHDDVVGTAFVIAWPLDRFQWLQNPDEVFGDVPDRAAGGS
ncbi:signal peptidase I [Kocuria sp. M1R5S2]|uniref:signal peptidase I n=1 Tax=Kocuria rhizosphaerae TaxID=3376285 RepID=UPI00378AB98C